jgi:hypothetical protein
LQHLSANVRQVKKKTYMRSTLFFILFFAGLTALAGNYVPQTKTETQEISAETPKKDKKQVKAEILKLLKKKKSNEDDRNFHWAAVASFILGIGGVILLGFETFGIGALALLLALIFGIVGLASCGQNKKRGLGLAIVGTILGGLPLALLILILYAFSRGN